MSITKKQILILLPSLNRTDWLMDCLASFIRHDSGLADYIILRQSLGLIAVYNSVPHELLNQYDVVGLMGDDVRMHTSGWDKIVLSRMGNPPGLVYGRDGFKDSSLCTQPFISTKILRALGFVQPPCLEHFYGDNFFMDLLSPMNLVHYVPEIFAEHLHFSAGKSPKDDTYQRAESSWMHDTSSWAGLQHQLPEMRQRIEQLMDTENGATGQYD